ncbi:MAG: bifunctional uridylyltransferase/uridylyl-removing protein, partial [Asticcacaulis sp.]
MPAPALSSPPKAVVLPDGLDGRLLRSALSEAADTASGQSSALRKAAVAILKPAWLKARDAVLARLEQRKPNGTEVACALSACADEIVTALWDFTHVHVYRARNPTEGERLTLLAVGGYGRGEMAPFSDLDLLFLRAWKETPHGESVIEFMLYALWDMGFKVGWASRTIDETLKLAQGDHTIQTGLLECRFLAGDADMAATLQKRIQLEARKADQARAFAAAKLSERDARHAKSGATRFVVEPNIKDGKGGLRDLNTLYWIARSLHPDQPSGQAALDPLLTAEERRTFAQSLEYLWRVRIHLHQAAGRGEERLTFDRQPEIAARMGYRDRGDSSGVERFMRRYFMTAKEVGALTRTFCAKLEADHAKVPQGLSRFLPGNRTKARKLEI